MVYGAYGYTGELVAKLAVQRGERPLLAGRSAEKLAPLAQRLGCEYVAVALDNRPALRAALAEVQVVAHCAGPFARTSRDMVDACLDTGTHYLDITGEIDVFEDIYARDDEAAQAGVVLLPGGGFDVVPTDCLAALLAARLPGAEELDIAFTMVGGISPGTLKTAIEGAAAGGRARIDGKLQTVQLAHRTTVADFPSGPKRVTAIPWGDVSSAYRSTHIPTITTYTALPGGDLIGRGQQYLAPLLRMPAVQRAGVSLVDRLVKGPSADRQATARTEIWGRVRHPDGHVVAGALSTPGPYALTADAVLRGVAKLAAGEVAPGAHTPSSAFGGDFVTELDGVRLGDMPPTDKPPTDEPPTDKPPTDEPPAE